MAQAAKKKVFDGRYEIISIVGRGAASVVYHARHISDPSTEVALKVLLAQKDGSPTAQRLRKEALAMVSSRHRYVIRLDDFHSVGELSYLSMEYAPESDLRKYIAKKGGSLPKAQIELFLLQAAEGLGFVHQAGIVHRDIKPDNLLVISDKEIRLGDFDTAVLPGEPADIEELQKGVGTFDYMAPETIEGKACDKRSDVYALGVSFYEILAGKNPFAGVPMAKLLDARRDENITPISEAAHGVPPHLAQTIMRAIRLDPSERFPSARELVHNLLATRSPGERVLSVISSSKSAEETAAKTDAPSGLKTGSPDKKTEVVRAALTQAMPTGSNLAYKQDEEEEFERIEESPEISEDAANMDDEDPISSEDAGDLESEVPTYDGQRSATERKTEHRSLSGRAFDIPAPMHEPVAKAPRLQSQQPRQPRKRPDHTGPSLTSAPIPKQPAPISPSPGKPLGMAARVALAACLISAAAWHYWPSSNQSTAVETQEPRPVVESEAAEPAQAHDGEEMSANISRNSGNFPYMAPGVYHGAAEGVIPGRSVPLTIFSFEEPRITVVALGIDGWRPMPAAPIETRNDDGSLASIKARVASNGVVLEMTGSASNSGWAGTFTNVLTRESGTWSIQRQ